MADIPVKPRRATPWWLWLVAALALAALAWFALSLLGGGDAGDAGDAEGPGAVDVGAVLRDDGPAPLALSLPDHPLSP